LATRANGLKIVFKNWELYDSGPEPDRRGDRAGHSSSKRKRGVDRYLSPVLGRMTTMSFPA
jgi:hypothetical protein